MLISEAAVLARYSYWRPEAWHMTRAPSTFLHRLRGLPPQLQWSQPSPDQHHKPSPSPPRSGAVVHSGVLAMLMEIVGKVQ